MPPPAVSVIMSVRDGEKTLSRAINSILDQSFSDFEFIVINDGSVDKTPDIIDYYAAIDKRVVAFHQDNIGLTKSLNRAIRVANGKYIARQDADDVSLPDRLRLQFKLAESQQADMVAGDFKVVEKQSTGHMLSYVARPSSMKFLKLRMLLSGNKLAHTTLFFRRIQGLEYNEQFKYSQDFELLLRFIRRHRKVSIVPEVVAQVHKHNTSISSKHLLEQSDCSVKAIRMHFPGVSPLVIWFRMLIRESAFLKFAVRLRTKRQ